MKVGVFIARMQVPYPHEGHCTILDRMLEDCDKVIVLLGSANRAISIKNPYSFRERRASVNKALSRIACTVKNPAEYVILPLNDYLYDDPQWLADVAATVSAYTTKQDEIYLFGHYKEGNDYLKWFPQYKYVNINSEIPVCGTQIRNELFTKNKLPGRVMEDMRYFENEKKLFAAYPFPDTLNFNCSDALLLCAGHVLLIERGGSPGKGNWALPGGFKQNDETFRDAAIRELIEETNVRVPEKILRRSIVAERLFDSPNRGCGIPRNTLTVFMQVDTNPDGTLPRANGRDDAVNARWVPVETALNAMGGLHDDHGDIISTMTGVKPLVAFLNPFIN